MSWKKFFIRSLAIIPAAGLLVFLSGGFLGDSWHGRMVDAASPALVRIRRGLDTAREWLRGSSGRKIRALEDERIGLLAEIARREDDRRENEILREALAFRKEGETGVAAAKSVGFFREGRDEFLLLDRGTSDGISVGDLVIDKHRVLGGTVVGVSPRSSRVILLSSASRSTDVFIQGANLRAIARGANSRELIIDLVPQDAEVKVGDLARASSRSSAGRASLLVGEIRESRQSENDAFKTVRALHIFDPAEEEVLVLLAQ